ncbi:hypothetical protein SAMN02745136_00323 [Anaerocolumna jejuensis DSM 15929]|uniref:CvpA family protein n=1 Tax=Anaerocolumna jejuensis DSM 15929 TaxID=1121322 RepID=A0A1M6K4P9_9FIRM|nr:hypothetical protein [Anaerocolumna jejuensis]SHJ53936.1 hypothetical protein SAMN02745136_00323 [Anaerocolumna jejuensis DSM 15929]
MKKTRNIIISLFVFLLALFIYYYITLPAINVHSHSFWLFIITALIVLTLIIGFALNRKGHVITSPKDFMKGPLMKASVILTAFVILFYIAGALLSSPIINSGKYQKLLPVKEGDFKKDIKEISYSEIPVLDKASATLLGSRKMGSITEYVSQFEVSDNYTQINYKGVPTRVTPLQYGNAIKWITNHGKGIPAYMRIDMTTENVELVKLSKGIKYSQSDHFGRNLNRYLRFHYPTYVFSSYNFEIDEAGIPYWVCPVKDYTIGLFGGESIGRVVLVNAVTGDLSNYKVSEVPEWVDRVYSAELLIQQFNYYGTLKHGYFNSIFSQKDSLQTTKGYNYLALEDDVWVYTGITSVGQDESNVGFVLMNQRTAETRYYSISGAEEYSAMASAEGQVQHLGYTATFPLLLNIGGEPTYFIALKDAAGLVKSYAMVNISRYQIVATAETIKECERQYLQKLQDDNIIQEDTDTLQSASGNIAKLADVVIDGNTHYYILLQGNEQIFDINVAKFPEIIRYNAGDFLKFTYTPGTAYNTVEEIQK